MQQNIVVIQIMMSHVITVTIIDMFFHHIYDFWYCIFSRDYFGEQLVKESPSGLKPLINHYILMTRLITDGKYKIS